MTGQDSVLIVPPRPILPSGGIPVPAVDLTPLPFQRAADALILSFSSYLLVSQLPPFPTEPGVDHPAPVDPPMPPPLVSAVAGPAPGEPAMVPKAAAATTASPPSTEIDSAGVEGR